MGFDISYQCTKAIVTKHLGHDKEGNHVLFCDLEFDNEHGIALAPAQAVVVVRNRGADIETYPENILDESLPEEEYDDKYEALAEWTEKGRVGFHVTNTEELRTMLIQQTWGSPKASSD